VATPWDDQLFGCLGDVTQDTVATVILPETAFNLTAHNRVYTEGALPDQLALLQPQDRFPQLGAAVAESELLWTRSLMYLPARFAHLFLNTRGLPIKEAYLTFRQAVQKENGPLEDVQSLLDWFQLTLHATQDYNSGPPVTSLAITLALFDEDLSAHRSPLTAHVLAPRPQNMSTGLEMAINHMATAVTQQTAEVNRTQLARAIEREAPATPASKFGLLLDSLKNYLSVEEEQDLPEFWFQFAAASKKQEFSVLRDYLELYARSDNAFIPASPILSPKLHSDLATVTFVADHHNDLKTGIQPFVAMDGSEEHRAAAMELARSYGLLYERDYGVSFADLSQLKVPKDLRSYPTTFYDLERSLGLYGNVLGAILGETHPLTTAYRPFWEAFNRRYRDRLIGELEGTKTIKPVHILRNIQLKTYDWFDAKRTRTTPDTPNFLAIWQRIGLNEYNLPNLPPSLYYLIYPRTTLLKPPPSDKSVITPSITETDASSTVSGVSALTGATGATGSGTRTGFSRAGDMVVNESPDPHLLGLVPFNKKLKDIIGNTQSPANDAGEIICLSYHVKGGCFTNCRRKNTHGTTLSFAEKSRLENYIADRLEKLGR
jgi:hypothetical protein